VQHKKGRETMRKKLNSKGFTLIELLIVIIIIGILAAIAFVAYSGSQNKAHKADAQSTLAEIRNKLGEYNADNGNYPDTQSDLNTWLSSSDGGNNSTLAGKFTTTNGYTYTASGCDGSNTNCTGYSATAAGTIFGGASPADDITVTN
jgi:type II secretion system protein G